MSIPILLSTRDGEMMPEFAVSDGTFTTIEDNDGNVSLEVRNDTAGTLNLTVVRQAILPDGDVAGPKIIPIYPDTTVWCGPWPPAIFNDDANRVLLTPEAGLGLRGIRW